MHLSLSLSLSLPSSLSPCLAQTRRQEPTHHATLLQKSAAHVQICVSHQQKDVSFAHQTPSSTRCGVTSSSTSSSRHPSLSHRHTHTVLEHLSTRAYTQVKQRHILADSHPILASSHSTPYEATHGRETKIALLLAHHQIIARWINMHTSVTIS